jgi:hypothetical protein
MNVEIEEVEGKPIYEATDRLTQITKKRNIQKH